MALLSQGSRTFNRKVSRNISQINFLLEGQSENNLCVVVVDETIGQPEGSLFMERIASSVPPSTGVIISDLIVFADCFIGQLFVTIGTFVVGIVVSATPLNSLIGKKLNFTVCASLVPVTPVVVGEVVFIVASLFVTSPADENGKMLFSQK